MELQLDTISHSRGTITVESVTPCDGLDPTPQLSLRFQKWTDDGVDRRTERFLIDMDLSAAHALLDQLDMALDLLDRVEFGQGRDV